MNRDMILLRRIRWTTALFMLALAVSGITAIPVVAESGWLVSLLGLEGQTSATATTSFARWMLHVRETLVGADKSYPAMFYGFDWLAFGHVAIAISFIGALRDPVRNRWLFDFGLIACALVIPWAFVFGAVRGIPFWWQLIDCSFGVFGTAPLLCCRKWAKELEEHRGRGFIPLPRSRQPF